MQVQKTIRAAAEAAGAGGGPARQRNGAPEWSPEWYTIVVYEKMHVKKAVLYVGRKTYTFRMPASINVGNIAVIIKRWLAGGKTPACSASIHVKNLIKLLNAYARDIADELEPILRVAEAHAVIEHADGAQPEAGGAPFADAPDAAAPQREDGLKQNIDQREIMAIIKAITKKRSFVLWYGDIYDELRDLIEDDDEFHEIENKLYEDIVEGRIKNVYRFWGPCGDSECDIIVVSPLELDESQLKMLEELSQLYSFKGYDGDEDEREELTLTLHNLIKMWSSSCLKISGPAEAVYMLAKNCNLEIEEEGHLDRWYAGKIFYRIEGIDMRIVKDIGYCNDCVNFARNDSFIEKCRSWHFEDDDE